MEGSRMRSAGGMDTNNASNRMQAFEDEKKRIVSSCFSKKDENNELLESYITHLRIYEFGNYPSTPPPPSDANAARKERCIIVAVRTSGKLRIHKARENQNGSFSIGKTWLLDDLTAFRSYTVPITGSPEEDDHRQWAGNLGFTISLGKLYYWQAIFPKEKQFFIASVVKIYSKYTGGSYPQFAGFAERELEQLLGSRTAAQKSIAQQQQLQQQAQQSQAPLSGPMANPPLAQPQSRAQPRDPSREPRPRQQPSREPVQRPSNPPSVNSSSYTSQRPPPSRERRDGSPNDRRDFGTPGTPQSNIRRVAESNQSQESLSTDASSLPPRSRSGMSGMSNMPGRFPGESITPTSLRAMTPESGYQASINTLNDVPPMPSPAPLTVPPERRRPPMPFSNESGGRSANSNDNFVPAPLASPARRRDDIRPTTPSGDALSLRTRDERALTLNSDPIAKEPQEIKSHRSDKSEDVDLNAAQETKGTQVLGETPSQASPPTANNREPLPSLTTEDNIRDEGQTTREPMIKKKLYANKLMSAAKAVNAFTPRAGGAGQRRQNAPSKPADGPDGITGVVPAPSLLRTGTDDSLKNKTPASNPVTASNQVNQIIPEVKVTEVPVKQPQTANDSTEVIKDTTVEKPKTREVRRQKPPAEIMDKELRAIGIDPIILGDRGGDLIDAWEEFGFAGQGLRSIDVDKMQVQVQQELNKIQTGTDFLKFMNDQDERVESVHKGFDITLEACEELDALLTLYLVELDTLTPDIAFIEAQSQGLQVQAANQKLLQAELESLLQTISISSDQLGCLRDASIGDSRGLEQIEDSLVMLYKAMITIDPTLSASSSRPSEDGSLKSGARSGYDNSDIGKMRVLQEKKDVYQNESALFLQRLKSFLQIQFAVALDETRKALDREKNGQLPRAGGKVRTDPRNHDLARAVLWKYNPLMLFSREVDRFTWEEFIKSYEFVCKSLYQNEFQDAISSWQRLMRKPSGDEGDILFTAQQEKQTENLATTARKLTVKRSQTLAKSLRSPVGDGKAEKSSDGRLHPYEVFTGIMDEVVPIVTMEQNFIVEFFHLSSLEQHDFPEAVALASPDARRGGDLRRVRVMEPQRELARQVVQVMEDIYSFLPGDLQKLVDQAIRADALQGVGVIAAIERKLLDLEETSQEYLNQTLQKIHSRLLTLFNKFLDEQIRAIEETKVKIKKRKGVIAFVRIFPSFSTAIETMLVNAPDLEIRTTVNNAYIRINKAMFESLKVIARETPGAQTASADPEDKEALNYQVLLIENMNHYLEEVDTRSNSVLDEWKSNAAQEMDEHMNLYLNAVIRRPLGKLLDTLESTESLMASRQPGEGFSKIAAMPSHSKSTFKKVLQNYDAKEIRKGIEGLKRRIAKHFGEGDEVVLSQGLVGKVVSNCERFYERVEERILIISRDIYDGEVVAEWTRADVAQAFKSK